MVVARSDDKALAVVKLSDEFAALVYRDLTAKKLKPVLSVLDAHKAKIVGDYRACVEEFVAAYGRKPHAGFYETMKMQFNMRGQAAHNWVFIEGPTDEMDTLLTDMKTVGKKTVIDEIVLVMNGNGTKGPQ